MESPSSNAFSVVTENFSHHSGHGALRDWRGCCVYAISDGGHVHHHFGAAHLRQSYTLAGTLSAVQAISLAILTPIFRSPCRSFWTNEGIYSNRCRVDDSCNGADYKH